VKEAKKVFQPKFFFRKNFNFSDISPFLPEPDLGRIILNLAKFFGLSLGQIGPLFPIFGDKNRHWKRVKLEEKNFGAYFTTCQLS